MNVLGVDENGMGPRLGPLVATAVLLRGRSYNAERTRAAAKATGIDDSKATGAFGRMAACESLTLALLEAVGEPIPRIVDDLLASVALGGLLDLRAPCPSTTRAQCWGDTFELPACGGSLEAGRTMLEPLAKLGLRPTRVRSALLCPNVLNAEFEKGTSKLVIDLDAFERLILDAHRATGTRIEALCGMVGGMRNYGAYFQHLRAEDITVQAEERKFALYSVRGLGRVRFEVDADALHTPVALASMVGKYLRELWMERQNRFYASQDPSLPMPSGYHDPVTARFVEASAPLRRRLHIADTCFERTR
ncbi:MAG: hypothetical protein KC417_11845 [Myxococcales bacterium]|nr:hypothetical protein [Myxococcales bacterium]